MKNADTFPPLSHARKTRGKFRLSVIKFNTWFNFPIQIKTNLETFPFNFTFL